MTKCVLCGKIFCMKKVLSRKNLKFGFLLLSLVAFALGIFCLRPTGISSAYAENVEYSNLIPSGELEQKQLISPIDCYIDEDVVAIIHSNGETNQSLLIFSAKDGFTAPIVNADFQNQSLKQVKRFSEDKLIVSKNGVYELIDISNGATVDRLSFGGTFFDINQKYLVSGYSNTVKIYNQLNFEPEDNFLSVSETPVAINSNNEVFYVADSSSNYLINIHKIDSEEKDQSLLALNNKPTSIIADQNYCYVLEQKIYRIEIATGNVEELSVIGDENFELGNVSSPTSLSFRGENLVVTDSAINAVQEFKVTDKGLDFTGFAIANGKTAFNRISANATEIESYMNLTAVLDENKLTVIKTDENFNPYSRESFMNFVASDMGGSVPEKFALGKGDILLGYATSVKLLSISDSDSDSPVSEIEGISNSVKDICFQNGTYYILTSDGENSTISTLTSGESAVTVKTTYPGIVLSHISVDLKNQIYLADGDNVYLNEISNVACPAKINGVKIKKISTDLAGRIFASEGNKIYRYDDNSKMFVESSTFSQAGIKSFAINYDCKKVSYLTTGLEFVRYTEQLDNLSIDSLSIPENYLTKGLNATQPTLGSYDIYSVADGANIYSVDIKDDGFKFNDLAKDLEDYILICDIPTGIDDFTLSALASSNGTVLVDKTDISGSTKTAESAPKSVYITTKVNAYYLPIITKDSLYSIVADQTDYADIRIDVGTVVQTINKVTVLNEEFYYACFEFNGETRYCYIPVGFTVEVPYIESGYEKFKLENVESTAVYAESALQNNLFTLKEGQAVRVYKTENGVCLISFQNEEGEWLSGYISSKYIINKPNRSIRNIIIISAVALCICASTAFLILKKKKKAE